MTPVGESQDNEKRKGYKKTPSKPRNKEKRKPVSHCDDCGSDFFTDGGETCLQCRLGITRRLKTRPEEEKSGTYGTRCACGTM